MKPYSKLDIGLIVWFALCIVMDAGRLWLQAILVFCSIPSVLSLQYTYYVRKAQRAVLDKEGGCTPD